MKIKKCKYCKRKFLSIGCTRLCDECRHKSVIKQKKDNNNKCKLNSKKAYQKNPNFYRKKSKKSFKKWYSKEKNKIYMKEYMKNYYNKDSKKHKIREISRKIIIPKGTLCCLCKKRLAKERHHSDYSKPYKVDLVCKPCHGVLNRKY